MPLGELTQTTIIPKSKKSSLLISRKGETIEKKSQKLDIPPEYSIGIPLPPRTRSLISDIYHHCLTCPICLEIIEEHQAIWNCPDCKTIIHLECIHTWRKQCLTNPKQSLREILEEEEDLRRTSGLPPVRHHTEVRYIRQDLFHDVARLVQEQEQESRSMQLQRSISSQLEEAPRSKPSQPKVWTCPSCRHKFPQSDESTTTSSCYCGATTQHITDFDRRGGKKSTKSKAILRTSHLHDSSFPHSCGNICGKVLDCGLHRCRLPCHPGECYSCSAPPHSCQCMCGKEPREVGCEIIASVRERERRAGGSDGYSGEWLNLK
ncbi:Transcription factor NFX1 family like protein, partial [Aduncisulcus paluster]